MIHSLKKKKRFSKKVEIFASAEAFRYQCCSTRVWSWSQNRSWELKFMVLVSGLKGLELGLELGHWGLADSDRDRVQDLLTIFNWILSIYSIVKIKHLMSLLCYLCFVLVFYCIEQNIFDWDILFSMVYLTLLLPLCCPVQTTLVNDVKIILRCCFHIPFYVVGFYIKGTQTQTQMSRTRTWTRTRLVEDSVLDSDLDVWDFVLDSDLDVWDLDLDSDSDWVDSTTTLSGTLGFCAKYFLQIHLFGKLIGRIVICYSIYNNYKHRGLFNSTM